MAPIFETCPYSTIDLFKLAANQDARFGDAISGVFSCPPPGGEPVPAPGRVASDDPTTPTQIDENRGLCGSFLTPITCGVRYFQVLGSKFGCPEFVA